MRMSEKRAIIKRFMKCNPDLKIAFDGCHKIYILENAEQEAHFKALDYEPFLPITELQETFENSCGLRFISFGNLDKPDLISQMD